MTGAARTHPRSRLLRPGRVLSSVVVVLLVAGGVAACSDPPAATGPTSTAPPATDPVTGEPTAEPDLRFGLVSEPGPLDPIGGRFDRATYQVARALFDPLMAYDDRLDLQPVLAESVTASEDLRTWTINVRPGVRFHGGRTLDAGIVADLLDRARGSQAFALELDLITSVEAVDAHRVVVQMREPWSTFPHVLAGQLGLVTARRATPPATGGTSTAAPGPDGSDGSDGPDGAPDPTATGAGSTTTVLPTIAGKTTLDGTGPFRLAAWDPGRALRVIRNDDYWRNPAASTAISFRFVPDGTARAGMVASGELDVAQFDEPAAMAETGEAAGRGVVVVHSDRAGETEELVLALATDRPPFDERSSRLALAEAIDRDAVSRRVFNGQFPPAEGPFSEGSRWYGQAQWPLRDPNAARDELSRRADPTVPLTFELLVEDSEINRRLVEELGFQLQEIGIYLEPRWVERSELVARVADWRFTAALVPLFGGQHPDEDFATLHSRSDGSGFANQWIDEALVKARARDDVTGQAEAFQTVQEQLARELPFVFLVRLRDSIVTQPRVAGLQDWTLPNGRPGLIQLRGTVDLANVRLT